MESGHQLDIRQWCGVPTISSTAVAGGVGEAVISRCKRRTGHHALRLPGPVHRLWRLVHCWHGRRTDLLPFLIGLGDDCDFVLID